MVAHLVLHGDSIRLRSEENEVLGAVRKPTCNLLQRGQIVDPKTRNVL